MENYRSTWQALDPMLATLLKDSTTDRESLTRLTQALDSSEADSLEVSRLSTTLSGRFKALSISYETAKFINKLAVPAVIVLTVALVASVATDGFTKF